MAEMDYDKMLDRALMALPKKSRSGERFEMPRAESFTQGNKTIVKNFSQIVKKVNAKERHLLKFLTKESGTSSGVEGERLFFNRKIYPDQVQKMFEDYINQFILCPECKKPDTKAIEKSGIKMLKCEACGAVSAIKGL